MSDVTCTTEEVLFHIDDGIAVIKLNRPERMNAVNNNVRERLISLLTACEQDDKVRALVVAGEGGRALSSGQDLTELAAVGRKAVVEWQEKQKLLLDTFRKLTKPSVTAVEGVCAGLGFHMSLCTDWRVAPENSTWGQPEVKVGLASITGPYLIGLHVGHTHNLQLSLMADLITGKRAHEIGLLTELCDEGRAFAVAMSRARTLASLPRTAIRLTKQRYSALTQPGFDEAFADGIEAQLECFASGEPQEMIASFIAKRAAASTRQ